MTKFKKSVLALLAVAALGVGARAVWDSTLGNMPNTYPLCWGAGASACFFGNSTTGQIGVNTQSPTNTLTVSGTANVTGATTLGSLTVSGATTLGVQSALTPQTTTQLLTVTPAAAGAQVSVQLGAANTNYTFCAASNTTQGAWVYLSSSATAATRACQ